MSDLDLKNALRQIERVQRRCAERDDFKSVRDLVRAQQNIKRELREVYAYTMSETLR